ncbi:MAG: polyribonucleotide nucleotidyltransferase [Aeriscardovia sp.]|nr:polyribonucleotide nucleotidyltransferase [Aeriscardovia sp.]
MKDNGKVVAVEAVIDNGKYGKRVIRLETGSLAQQADGSVVAYLDDKSMVLSTTTVGNLPKERCDFLPLTVDVVEKMYACGQIPGSVFRREGKPSEEAILVCRLIDRSLRPLFPRTLRNELQIIDTVLSVDPEDTYDILSLNAASASTCIAGIPFRGPVGAVRLALIDGEWLAFPRLSERKRAVFELTLAGRMTEKGQVAVTTIEACAGKDAWNLIHNENQPKPDEDLVAEGVELAKHFIQMLCEAQLELKRKTGKARREVVLFPEYEEPLYKQVSKICSRDLDEALLIPGKMERRERLNEILEHVHAEMAESFKDMDPEEKERQIDASIKDIQKSILREHILKNEERVDGRGLDDLRSITAEIDIIPRTHGSSLFQRGETQVLGVTTLGTLRMAQQLDSISGPESRRYIHQYNMPPFSTGETGHLGSPKRREIGHGALVRKALTPVLPEEDEFPYAIRQVSEAIGSNGSTSMGSVCASTLSLLDAGVPLKASVAGVAMGLVCGKVGNKTVYKVLTDILGIEDAFGDMDFKVAGTSEFLTALQLDTKLDAIPADVLSSALYKAKKARLEILSVMDECIEEPAELSDLVPVVLTLHVSEDKIGEVIGARGKNINQLQSDYNCEITVEKDGTVYITSQDASDAKKACEAIEGLVSSKLPEVGEIMEGEVTRITSFGIFVSLAPGLDGLLHISQLGRISDSKEGMESMFHEGQRIKVVVKSIDSHGRVTLALPDSSPVASQRFRRQGGKFQDSYEYQEPPRGFRRQPRFSGSAEEFLPNYRDSRSRFYDRSEQRGNGYRYSADFNRDSQDRRSSFPRRDRSQGRYSGGSSSRFADFSEDNNLYSQYRQDRDERMTRPRRHISHDRYDDEN